MKHDTGFAISRRTFAASGLVAGFALAGGPVRADAIVTDANGLDAGEISIPVSDGEIPGYRAKPKDAAKSPAILVVQEVFGVHEHIRDICRRFAKAGYYAVAPSLYARQGDPGKYDLSNVSQLFSDIVSKVGDAQVMSDLDQTAKFARSDGADLSRLGITGFCWGGRIVWLYCAHSSAVRAGVAWYGPLKGEKSELRPFHPIDIAAQLKAPVLGQYGGMDKGITSEDVEAMRSALKAAGKTDCRIDVFADAGHGFFADYRPSYNAKDAAIGWQHCLAWMREYGVG
ncbi:MAG TPA: dienelactone hydrolase family protein [Rhizomicrobium sp.]|nr:dienelactone hydrolase family protein [Rhizomicrobium sp.]